MATQNVIINSGRGRKTVRETISIPANEELIAAAVELRRLGGDTHPAAGQFGNCIGIYIPKREYSVTSVDPFTGDRGATTKGGTIPAACAFWIGSEARIADTMYEHEPPQIHYYCKQASGAQQDLFDQQTHAIEEGAASRSEQSEYERNPLLRELCIRHHGCRCVVCGMSFEELYGQTASGFIHVHHLNPLSAVAQSHLVDPINDLVPICPNCHAIVHRKDPPYTPSEVRTMLTNSSTLGRM